MKHQHSMGWIAAVVFIVLGFGASTVFGVPYVMFIGIVLALGFGFILGTAWMRPDARTPEHHPRVDRLLDDLRP